MKARPKGVIEKIFMLIWVLAPVLVIVSVHGANIVRLVEGSAQVEARFGAMEIASAISTLQSGPDGVQHSYPLPSLSMPDCVKIYPTYVETRFGQAKSRSGSAALVERSAFSAAIAFESAPITINCTAGRRLVMKKESGRIHVSAG